MAPKIIPQRHNLRRHLEHYGKIRPVRWEWVIVFVTNDIKTWALKSIGTCPRAPSSFSGSFLGGCQWQFEIDTEVFDVENPQRLQSSPWSVASPPRRSESAPPHPRRQPAHHHFNHQNCGKMPSLAPGHTPTKPHIKTPEAFQRLTPFVRFFS